jgi:hypothetical protein
VGDTCGAVSKSHWRANLCACLYCLPVPQVEEVVGIITIEDVLEELLQVRLPCHISVIAFFSHCFLRLIGWNSGCGCRCRCVCSCGGPACAVCPLLGSKKHLRESP